MYQFIHKNNCLSKRDDTAATDDYFSILFAPQLKQKQMF